MWGQAEWTIISLLIHDAVYSKHMSRIPITFVSANIISNTQAHLCQGRSASLASEAQVSRHLVVDTLD